MKYDAFDQSFSLFLTARLSCDILTKLTLFVEICLLTMR